MTHQAEKWSVYALDGAPTTQKSMMERLRMYQFSGDRCRLEILVVGNIVTVNVGGGKTWSGVVIELLHQQNALDLVLSIIGTRHPLPVC